MLKIIPLFCILLMVKVVATELLSNTEFAKKIVKVNTDRADSCLDKTEPHYAKSQRGCAWYFACDAERTVIREDKCPDGYWFDEANQNCNFKVNVQCDLEDQWKDLVCNNDEPGITLVPHPSSCAKFIVCFDGTETVRSCPLGTHYSAYEGGCVEPFYADCSLDKTLCKEQIEANTPGFLKDPNDCGSFYLCLLDSAIPLRCAPGQWFNLELGWCEVPENPEEPEGCEIVTSDDILPDTISIDCTKESTLEVPHPESCEFYFLCVGNRSYLRSCGADLIFDIKTMRCQRYPNNPDPDEDDLPVCILELETASTEST